MTEDGVWGGGLSGEKEGEGRRHMLRLGGVKELMTEEQLEVQCG